MAGPIALVPKPRAADEVRESVVRLLRKSLEEAEAGELVSIVMILKNNEGAWLDRCSDTEHFSECIGRLEITKQEWIAQYLRDK